MKSHSRPQLLAALCAVALAAGAVIGHAATVTWDANGTTGGVTDGGGAWLGANQWWDGTSNVTWTSGDDAVFGVGGTGGAVTLSATTAAGSLTFNPFSGTYTLGTAGQTLALGSGGLTMNSGAGAVTLSSPVTLGAAQSWTNNSSSLLTASAAINNGGNLFTVAGSGNTTLAAVSGAGGLTKSGAGILTLAGSNSYTGGTIVSGGTLTLAAGNVAGYWNGVIRGSLTVSNGATVNATQAWSLGAGGPNSPEPTTQSVTDISLNGGTLNITSGALEGGMSPTTLTMTGGSITGQRVDWYYGNSSAVSLVTNASSTTSTVSAPIALRLNKTAGAGSLTFDVAAGTTPNGVDLLVSGAIGNSAQEGGGGRIIKSGAGTLLLSGLNTFTGGVTVTGGTLALQGINGGPGALPANTDLTITNATATTTGTAFNALSLSQTSGVITINSGGLLFAGNSMNNAHNVFNVVLAGGTMASGTGSLNGTFANWYVNGGITATGSTISTISASLGRSAANAALAVTVDPGSTLNVSGRIVNLSGANGLTKSGSGLLILSGSNTFSGGLTLSAGQLDVNSATALGTGTFTIAGGTIGNSSGGAVTLSTNNAQAWTGDFTFAGPSNLNLGTGGVTLGANRTVTVASGLLTVGGALSGTGALTKSGGGALTLGGANSYTGGTIVSGGTLNLADGSVSGAFNGVIRGSLTVTDGATVNATRSWSLGAGGPNSSQPTTQSVTDITLTGGTLNITAGNLVGGMSPTTITMTAGSLTGLPFQWYYGNSSTVSLVTNASGTTSTVSAPIALRLNKTAGAGSLTFDVAAGTTPNGVDLLVSGAISNSDAAEEGSGGGIVKTGAGRMVLSATNTFTGSVTVSSGTFEIAGAGVLGSGNYAGAVSIGEGARFVYGSSANQTLSSVLSGSGGLTKTGGGTLTFGNVRNSYTGGTIVDGGTLTLGSGAADGNIRGSLTINQGATVNASAFGWSLGYGGTRAGASYAGNSVTSIAINGGLLNFTNALSGAGLAANEIVLTGGTIGGASFGWINTNTLTPALRTLASSSRSTLSGGISLRLGTSGTLSFDVASGSTADGIDLLVSGPITTSTDLAPDGTHAGNIAKTGAGTMVLSASNTFNGTTRIVAGSLSLANTSALRHSTLTMTAGDTGSLVFGLSGTNTYILGGLAGTRNLALPNGVILSVGGNQTATTYSGTLSGSGALTKIGAGTLTLGNVRNSYTGGTIVDGGTLTLGSGAADGNIRGSLTINQGATVNASANGWSLGFGGTRAGATFAGNSVTSIAINGGVLNVTNPESGAGLAANEIVLTGGTIGGASFGWINSNTLTPTLRTLASSSRSTLSGGISLRLSTSGTLTFDVASGSTADRVDLLVSGPITNSTSPDSNIGGNLTKTGAGTLALAAANTFTGSTLISAGRLQIDSTGSLTATSGITINGGELKYNAATALARPLTFTAGTISGTGTIGTAVTVAANDVLSPGNSPGSQAYTAGLTWSGSGSYLWELNALSGTAGVNWDVINVSGGTFNLSGLSAGNRFILDLTTLTGANAPGPLDVAYDGGTYTFPIATYTSLSTSLGTTALTDLTSLFDIRLTNWASPAPTLSNVSVRINSAADGLELIVVPEPGTLALVAIGVVGVACCRRRRRR